VVLWLFYVEKEAHTQRSHNSTGAAERAREKRRRGAAVLRFCFSLLFFSASRRRRSRLQAHLKNTALVVRTFEQNSSSIKNQKGDSTHRKIERAFKLISFITK